MGLDIEREYPSVSLVSVLLVTGITFSAGSFACSLDRNSLTRCPAVSCSQLCPEQRLTGVCNGQLGASTSLTTTEDIHCSTLRLILRPSHASMHVMHYCASEALLGTAGGFVDKGSGCVADFL